MTEIVLRSVSRCGYGCGITLVPLIAWAKKTTSTSEQACIKTALWKVCAHYEQKCTSSVHAFYSYLETVLKSVGIQFSEGSSFTFCFNINRLFPQILSLFLTSLSMSGGQPASVSPEMGACSILHPLPLVLRLSYCWTGTCSSRSTVWEWAYTTLHIITLAGCVTQVKPLWCLLATLDWQPWEENKIKLQLLIKINNVFI